MGMRMPETCWAVFKWQVINLQSCCIWLIDLVEIKWARPFRRKTKSGFCACAITFQTQSTRLCDVITQPSQCGAYVSKCTVAVFIGMYLHRNKIRTSECLTKQLTIQPTSWNRVIHGKLTVVFLLLGDFPASEFCVSTFRNTLFHLHKRCKYTTYEDGTDRVFRNVGI